MSTYMYYECQDHDPVLQSKEEFTQHWGDAFWKQGLNLMFQRPLDRDWINTYWRTSEINTYFEGHARDFLVDHPHCRLLIVDEYGRHYDPLTENRIND